MREYETIYLLKPDLPAETSKMLLDKVVDIISKQNGHVLIKTDWGKRRLSYRIEKFNQAQYFYLLFLDAGQAVAEIERILKLDDRVLRFLTVKLKDKVNVEDRLSKPLPAPLPPEEPHSYQMEEPRPMNRDRGGPSRYRGPDSDGPGMDSDEPIAEAAAGDL